MTLILFSDLPDSARLWIYGADQSLRADQVQAVERHMGRFMAEWHSHKREVAPGWQLVHDRFVVIGVDETALGLSGCSIDSMFRALDAFSRASGLNFSTSGAQVFYRDARGEIQCVDRLAFGDLARQGAVDPETIVFDNTIQTVGEFRAGRWELPMRDSWHMQVFGKNMAK